MRMKRLLYIALIFVVLTLPAMKCEAQLSLVLKSLNVNNLNAETNHRYAPEKIRLGEKEITDRDLNVFFADRALQSDVVAGWTEVAVKKLKQGITHAREYCNIHGLWMKGESDVI